MTALTKYARLEASGLWRASPEAQRREVIVSIGDATLIISDMTDKALTHWSLAAIDRANPGERPAIFFPDGDPGETLELADDEEEMIGAIEKLRRAVIRRRPKPGRLRWVGVLASVALVLAVTLFWLPGVLRDHTLGVVPGVKRAEIGEALLRRIERVSGSVCTDSDGRVALDRLAQRLEAGRLVVLPAMAQPSLHLPGGIIVLNRSLIADHDEPDVAAGFILTEMTRRSQMDPLRALLDHTGLRENFRLLTTGDIASDAMDDYAKALLTRPRPEVATDAQLALFAKARLRSTPYAYAADNTGETTLPLIEADPMHGQDTAPLMTDADWLRLQNICGP